MESILSAREARAILQRRLDLRFKVRNENTPAAFARDAEVAYMTIMHFVNGEWTRNPNRSVMAKIAKEIERRGWLDKPEAVVQEPTKGAQEAPKELPQRPTSGIVIQNGLTDREKALLTYCIFHGQVPLDVKESLVRKLLPDTFPSL